MGAENTKAQDDVAQADVDLTSADSVPDSTPNDQLDDFYAEDADYEFEDNADAELDEPDDEVFNNPSLASVLRNPFFRCLGYHEQNVTLMGRRKAFIQEVKIKDLGSKVLMSLAPTNFWREVAPKHDQKGQVTGVDWDKAVDLIFRATETMGLWDDRKQISQGARIDLGRITYNCGDRVWVEGQGTLKPGDVNGEYCYVERIGTAFPDFNDPLSSDDPQLRDLLMIVKNIAWREEERALCEMTMFGYLCMSTICGVLTWRPHVWLDGSRGTGKTWIVQNLIHKLIRDNGVMVKSNSTESGLRNLLNTRAITVIFDEAEGSSQRDKSRMDEVISLARHTSSETDAVVAQGVSGGGASKSYEVSSMFFLASITTRIEKPSDKTRFARISLSPGLTGQDFIDRLEAPAAKLLTKDFSTKFIARMVLRAKDAEKVIHVMTQALIHQGMERRVADVYAVFAAGAWLALKDGVPENEQQGLDFIAKEFGAMSQIRQVNEELTSDRDHDRVLRTIMSANRRIETANGQAVTENVGVLMRIAANVVYDEDDDSAISVSDAVRELNNIGIKASVNGKPYRYGDPDQRITDFLIHKKSDEIRKILEKTPYETGYADVLRQAPGVRTGETVRFRGAAPDRALIVPAKLLFGE